MNHAVKTPTIAVLAACVVLAATAAQTYASIKVTGNDKGLWLIRQIADDNNDDDDKKSFDVAFKPVGEEWIHVGRGAGDRILAVAVGDGLNVLLGQPSAHLRYTPGSAEPTFQADPQRKVGEQSWPAGIRPIAAAEAIGLGEQSSPALLLVVPIRAAVEPSAQPTNESSGDLLIPASLRVFFADRGQWRALPDLTGLSLPPVAFANTGAGDGLVLAAVVDKTVYLLIAGVDNAPARLFAFKEAAWVDVPLPDKLTGAKPIAMLTLRERLTIFAADDDVSGKGASLLLARYDSRQKLFDVQTAAWQDTPASPPHWPVHEFPKVARLADSAAVVWMEDGEIRLAACDHTARLRPRENIDLFSRKADEDRGQRILEQFTWGVLLATAIVMFVFRPKTPPRLFKLPPGCAAGNLIKRLLAGLVDFFPALLIANLVFRPPPISLEKYIELLGQNRFPASMAYAIITSAALYIAYCTIMEFRHGATLGKKIFSLRVIGESGNKPTVREALLRNLLKIMEFQLLPLLVIFPLLMRTRQRLGDVFARTAVVDSKSRQAEPPPLPPLSDSGQTPADKGDDVNPPTENER